MPLNDEASAVARDAQLRVVTELVFLTSLQTERVVARGMCSLARQELGKIRLHHMRPAESAYQMVLELAKHRCKQSQMERHHGLGVCADTLRGKFSVR